MRLALILLALCAAATQVVNAQLRLPPDNLFRGPLFESKVARFIVPDHTPPLQFAHGTLSYATTFSLQTTVTSRSLRSIPVSGIMLRVAYGPTRHGIVTFRVRPGAAQFAEPPVRIIQGEPGSRVRFLLAVEDPSPGILAMSPQMDVVFTVERVEDDEGHAIFENPDAIELLWNALGRPTLSYE